MWLNEESNFASSVNESILSFAAPLPFSLEKEVVESVESNFKQSSMQP